jgi:hypothetical protein
MKRLVLVMLLSVVLIGITATPAEGLLPLGGLAA